MKRILTFLLMSIFATRVLAAWYWPFGSDDDKQKPRMSELMEEASLMIDEASDLTNRDKIPEAVAKYKEAYAELERIELENPERAATSEFSTVRNKKAYISAAIDSLLLDQAAENARAVSVTDTSELEKKYAEEMAKASGQTLRETATEPTRKAEGVASGDEESRPASQVQATTPIEGKAGAPKTVRPTKSVRGPGLDRRAKILLVAEDIKKKDYAAAELTVKSLLDEKPDDATALNLKAAIEAARGNHAAAKETLHRLIRSNPRAYSGYYNLARLIIQTEGEAGKLAAGRYYETGRTYGGPVDKKLEGMLK